MKNAATGIGLAILGIGIAVNGLNLNGNQANATTAAPVAFNAGPEEPTIVWYDVLQTDHGQSETYHAMYRAWSDGTIEWRWIRSRHWAGDCSLLESFLCGMAWQVLSSPNEGLNASADINHDEIVNAADIGLLVAAWGHAPRNPMPSSDCPLGLIQ